MLLFETQTRIIVGDCRNVLDELPEASVDCCVTSPPYYCQRDYRSDQQIGLEATPEAYVDELVAVFGRVRRVLKDTATLWLNLGDSYARTGTQKTPDGFKTKDLMMIPARVAIALCADGWYLRSDIIWHKANCVPESVTDRPTSAHEHVFLLSKQPRYFYDADAIREPHDSAYSRDLLSKGAPGGPRPAGNNFSKEDRQTQGAVTPATRAERAALLHPKGRNARNVWTINTKPYRGAHFATFPPELVRRCILAGCPAGGVVLDPFGGAGTTGLMAEQLDRKAILIELNEEYAALARDRLQTEF